MPSVASPVAAAFAPSPMGPSVATGPVGPTVNGQPLNSLLAAMLAAQQNSATTSAGQEQAPPAQLSQTAPATQVSAANIAASQAPNPAIAPVPMHPMAQAGAPTAPATTVPPTGILPGGVVGAPVGAITQPPHGVLAGAVAGAPTSSQSSTVQPEAQVLQGPTQAAPPGQPPAPQPQPTVQPAVQPTPAPADALDITGWQPYSARAYGILTSLLPPDTVMVPSNPSTLQGTIPPSTATPAPLLLEIELLFNPSLVQAHLAYLQSLTNHPETPLTAPLRPRPDVQPQAATPICLDAEITPAGAQIAIYKLALQSPFGHGLSITVIGPRDASVGGGSAAKRHGEAIARSLQWVDRSAVARTVTSTLANSTWRSTYPPPGEQGKVPAMAGVAETREYVFAGNARYSFSRSVAGVTDGYGNPVTGALGLAGEGLEPLNVRGGYEVFEYQGAANERHLVLSEDGGAVVVLGLTRGGEGDGEWIEVDGRRYNKVVT